jgi:hypothetical protein
VPVRGSSEQGKRSRSKKKRRERQDTRRAVCQDMAPDLIDSDDDDEYIEASMRASEGGGDAIELDTSEVEIDATEVDIALHTDDTATGDNDTDVVLSSPLIMQTLQYVVDT